MSYTKERDQFIVQASKEGLDLPTINKLLRYATTLQRLAVAQCNGDAPYNGDRDRPSPDRLPCAFCSGGNEPNCAQCQGTGWSYHESPTRVRHDKRYTTCPKCEASGVSKSAMRTSSEQQALKTCNHFGVCSHKEIKSNCPSCTGELCAKCDAKKRPFERVCPDCRTQEFVQALLYKATIDLCRETNGIMPKTEFMPIFGGDPRGAVLRLSTPNYPYDDAGKNGANGLYVPARTR